MSADPAVAALARLAHRYFVGLQMRVVIEAGRPQLGDWMFRLFRAQHEAKLLSSFAKLGLEGLPHAVACARYHVLSNAIGGVAVEYTEEGPRKAWVRFRYPRWIHDGPALAAMPVEASRGFLRGWYAQNGVSLGNPRLGFVCVSEDVPSLELPHAFGLCGYFFEHDHDLAPDERLRFAPGEVPPMFDPAAQLRPPSAEWSAERLAKAERNYAMEYLRNGIPALVDVLGREQAMPIAVAAAELTGLQSWRDLVTAAGGEDGGPEAAATCLARLLQGMGDELTVEEDKVHQSGLRVARNVGGSQRDDLLAVWEALWRGMIRGYRALLGLETQFTGDTATWRVCALDHAPGH